MARVITFAKGSKRRLKRIRWNFRDIASLTFLATIMVWVIMATLLWELRHEHRFPESPPRPQIRDSEPIQP